MMRVALVLVMCVAACGGDPAAPRQLSRAMPGYAPVSGGTLVTITGAGFDPDDRVLIDGREAPLVRFIDATQLAIVVPPGEQPGNVELVVFGTAGTTSSAGLLHYSEPPTVTAASPDDVVVTSTSTLVTLTGTGFADEGAGQPTLLVNGQPATGAVVVSDTEIRLFAPLGVPFVRPTLEVVNARGRGALARAFRYTPSAGSGLMLFTRFGADFAMFYDPATQSLIPMPALSGSAPRYRSVVRTADGSYWAMDQSDELGLVDLETQKFTHVTFVNTRMPTFARLGSQFIGIARTGGQFGTLDPDTGAFAPIGTAQLCCGSLALATDGTTVWFTATADFSTVFLNTIDPSTGNVGTPVALTGAPGVRIEELRHWRGVLYAVTTGGQLVRIDPQTGAVTVLVTAAGRLSALEPYE